MPTKFTFILIACSFCFGVQSQNIQAVQNSYGEMLYPHAGSILTSGSVTRNSPGFLMAGYKPVCGQGANFFIDRTAAGGNISNNPQGFQREYSLYVGNSQCAGPLTQAANCAGVSAIETRVPAAQVNGVSIPARAYAVAGAVDNGCFFSLLSANGIPVNTYFINFALIQNVPFLSGVSKPIILEASNPAPGSNEYYICGTYNVTLPIVNYPISVFYAHRINALGNIIWSRQYLCQTGGFINVTAMIESPYNQNLVLVGSTLFSGLLLELDRATGGTNVANASLYNAKNWPSSFASIVASNVQSGTGGGYIIGGQTTPVSTTGTAWMLKINPTGNVIWSTVVTPNSDPKAGNVTGVLERKNQTGVFEYYGVTSSIAGAMVLKLNVAGYPATNGANEFVYNAGTQGNPSSANSISFSDGLGIDDGLHVFGNNTGTAPGSHYLVEAYFSGHAGCNVPTSVKGFDRPEVAIGRSGLYDLNLSLSHCGGFSLTSNLVTAYNAQCGPSGSVPPPANNARTIATGIAGAQSNVQNEWSVFPNPVKDKAFITFTSSGSESTTKISLYNSVGQLIRNMESKGLQDQVELDFNAMNLESGVYIINAETDGVVSTQKIVYTKS